MHATDLCLLLLATPSQSPHLTSNISQLLLSTYGRYNSASTMCNGISKLNVELLLLTWACSAQRCCCSISCFLTSHCLHHLCAFTTHFWIHACLCFMLQPVYPFATPLNVSDHKLAPRMHFPSKPITVSPLVTTPCAATLIPFLQYQPLCEPICQARFCPWPCPALPCHARPGPALPITQVLHGTH